MDCPHCKSHQVGMICEIKKSHSFKKVAAYVGTGLLGVAGGIMLITPGLHGWGVMGLVSAGAAGKCTSQIKSEVVRKYRCKSCGYEWENVS